MKPPQFIVTVILSLVPLILVINLIFMGQKNQALQAQMQSQQEDIKRGSMAQQVGSNLLRDIGQASLKDEKLREVLARNGYSVNTGTGSSPAPTPPSTPASTP